MTATRKKQILLIGLALALVCAITVGSMIVWNSVSEDRLSEAEIAELRDQYPICGIEKPANVYMTDLTLERVSMIADSFVYGEVIGDYTTFFRNVSTGIEEVDEKREANGISNEYEFYEYTISVIEDSEGKYAKGDLITISSNVMFMDYNPKFSDGMRVIVPVAQSGEKPNRHASTAIGTYYVTEDGYAISAYEEDKLSSRSLNGAKVESLLNSLKKETLLSSFEK